MNERPTIGAESESTHTVERAHIIDFADDVMPPLLSTPALVWWLEHAARALMLPFLEEGESTVGVVVEVEHLAPAVRGASVRCQARLIHADKRVFSFSLRAWEGTRLLCRGTHKLRVVRKARLASAVTGGAG